MGLQEIQNERFENSEVMGKYWPKQDSEVLKYSTDKHDVSLPLPVAADEINKSEECIHRSLRPLSRQSRHHQGAVQTSASAAQDNTTAAAPIKWSNRSATMY